MTTYHSFVITLLSMKNALSVFFEQSPRSLPINVILVLYFPRKFRPDSANGGQICFHCVSFLTMRFYEMLLV